jgi:hypothetical protein
MSIQACFIRFTFAITICILSPLSLAQDRYIADAASPATNTQTAAPVAKNARAMPKSAFGQAMAVLTQLLQEAAKQQAARTPSNTGIAASLSAADPELSIRVTPADGQDTFAPPARTPVGTSTDTERAIDVQRTDDVLAQTGEDSAG